MEPTTKKVENRKTKSKNRLCSEVSANSPGILGVSRGEEEEGYGRKDCRKRRFQVWNEKVYL